jgi:hypothetical protein
LLESKDLNALMREAVKIASQALGVKAGYFFLKNPMTNRFECEVETGSGVTDDSGLMLSTAEIRKWLPSQLDEHVKLVGLKADHSQWKEGGYGESAVAAHEVPLEFAATMVDDEATLALVPVAKDVELTESAAGPLDSPESSDFSQHEKSERTSGTPKARFLILIAVSNQGSLLGWIALPDAVGRVSDAREMEQELMILGMHVGYIVGRMSSRIGWRSAPGPVPHETGATKMDPEVPDWIRVENYSSGQGWPHAGARIYGVNTKILIACVWKLESGRERISRRLGELIARHIQLFVQSLRLQSDRPQLQIIAEKLVSDFVSLFGAAAHRSGGLEAVDLNFLVFDCDTRRAYEGVFGAEMFSFSGECRVEREGLQEIHGVMGHDQSLIFRERQRIVKGHCGWAFGIDSQSRVALFRFADIDFMDRYLPHILQRQNLLPETLGVQSRGRAAEMFAFFVLDPEAVSIDETAQELAVGGEFGRQRRG